MCLGCGSISAREDLQTRFKALNPEWSVQVGAVAPDGDVFLDDEQVLQFRVPSCQDCGGVLKPEVTFFGDTVSKSTVHLVHDRLAESDALLVVGSSLQVKIHKEKKVTKSCSDFLSELCLLFHSGIFWISILTGSQRQENSHWNLEHWAH